MRYLLLISVTILLVACSDKIRSLKYAGEKVKQTVSVCTESVEAVCPEMEKTTVREDEPAESKNAGGGAASVSTSWDTHMMLW